MSSRSGAVEARLSPADSWQPNLSWVTPDLAIGGRFPSARAEHLAEALSIRAVVDLREEDRDEEELLVRHGITFLHLPTPDNCAVSQPMLDDGVIFARRHLERGERVLIHCEYGIGRSATLALCVMVARGMTPLEAVERCKTGRAIFSPSPVQFECWRVWMEGYRASHPVDWTVPGFDAFAAIAYRHLRTPS